MRARETGGKGAAQQTPRVPPLAPAPRGAEPQRGAASFRRASPAAELQRRACVCVCRDRAPLRREGGEEEGEEGGKEEGAAMSRASACRPRRRPAAPRAARGRGAAARS